MRFDQYVGLNQWAKRTVNRRHKIHEIGVSVLPSGKVQSFDRWVHVPVARREVIGKIPGTYKPTVAKLYRYTLPSGKVYQEYVQEIPWSGGPCYHIALMDGEGNVVPQSLWTREQLQNC